MTLSIKPSSTAAVARAEAPRDVAAPAAPEAAAAVEADAEVATPVDPARQGAARAAAVGAEAAIRDRLGSAAVDSPVDGPRRGLGQAPVAPEAADRLGREVDAHDFEAMSFDPDVRERGRIPNRRTASGETKKNPDPKR